ncbi:Sec-independent protein translocase subunit TatA [Streptomyces sp. NPDC057249]|uniref:Sec-independent protein translocase subunit TatA n=1 Tax=Streptomyces sp. NPDC057249 TaxID=3346067 RepID=UPI0036421F04
MFGKLGAPEIILILVVIILLFGAKKLPDMARSLGKSARILKSEAKAMKSEGGNTAAVPADPPNNDQDVSVPRTIKAAPGDVTSSRPVSEKTNQSQS